MKQRNGFVSNSSSSSFIIGLKPDQRFGQIKQLLFGDEKWYSLYNYTYDTDTLAQIIERDLVYAEPITRERMVELVGNGWMDGYPSMDYDKINYGPEHAAQNDALWAEHERLVDVFAEETIDMFLKDHPGLDFYELHYADEDGSLFCVLEHGDFWERVPYLRISNH